MEPTKVDPIACARLIVFNQIANGLCERNAAALAHALAPNQARSSPTLDDLIARETRASGCAQCVPRPLVPPNVALMIASIVSSVAVVLWCIGAQ